jgi:rhodanese-related sulfurtransferase
VTGAIDEEWETTPEAVAAALDEDGLEVVDVRNPASFREGHLPGSRNVPLAQLPSRVPELAGADRVVTVCPHGKASLQAARIVASYEGTADARVESMAGGLTAWDGPLETGPGAGAGVDDTGPGAEGDEATDEGPESGPSAPF